MRIGARRIVLFLCLLILLANLRDLAGAPSTTNAMAEDQAGKRKIEILESQLRLQSEQLDSLNTNLRALIEEQEKHVIVVETMAKNHSQQLEVIKKQSIQSSNLSIFGAIVLLTGMLFEILGALLLAAPLIAGKADELRDFDIDPGMDLSFHAPKKAAVLDFYATTGNLFLITGFTFQFFGTALVLSSWKIQFAFMLVGLGVIVSVLFWLLGLDPTQSRRQKIEIFCKNLYRNANIRASRFFLRGKECMACLKKVSKDQAFISWHDQGNISDFPYLHAPSDFLVGHEECIIGSKKAKVAAEANFEKRKEIEQYLKMQKGSEFASTAFKNYKNWFQKYYAHWLQIREDWPNPCRQEIDMDSAADRIKRIDS